MADSLIKETVSEDLLKAAEKLCNLPSLNDFNIVGGTALALQIGHRKSIDIDLFCNSQESSVNFAFILEECRGIFNDVNVETIFENRTLITRIDNIKVDFVVQRNSKMLDKPVVTQGLCVPG